MNKNGKREYSKARNLFRRSVSYKTDPLITYTMLSYYYD